MKIYRNERYVKNIPVKYKMVESEFNPTAKGKRLSVAERVGLGVLLTRYKLKEYLDSQPKTAQIQYALDSSDDSQIRDVIKVNRRNGDVEYRITFFSGVTIRVPYSVFCEYPKKFRDEKNEF